MYSTMPNQRRGKSWRAKRAEEVLVQILRTIRFSKLTARVISSKKKTELMALSRNGLEHAIGPLKGHFAY